MSTKETKKKRKKPIKKNRAAEVSKGLGVFYFLTLLVFSLLGVKLVLIINENNDEFKKVVLSQQIKESRNIEPKRGEIIDCNGTILATSKEYYLVVLNVKELLKYASEHEDYHAVEDTVNRLVELYDADRAAINEYIANVPNSEYYVIKYNSTLEEKTYFEELIERDKNEFKEQKNADISGNEEEKKLSKKEQKILAEKEAEYEKLRKHVVGVDFRKYYTRYYPQNTLACDVIGFTNSEDKGRYGLEQYYDDILTGTPGRGYGHFTDDTTAEYATVPATDGNTIITTLDSNIQSIVEKHLEAFSLEYKDRVREGFGAENIGCIVMRANTGEILAMASYPEFDLNNPNDLSNIYTDEQIKQMEAEETIEDARFAVWKNFCIQDTYEPGSVMKPFTVAMGLETGKITGNETYYCSGSLTVADHEIHCHNRSGDGTLDVKGAVKKSCNVALMYMSKAIGADTFLQYQNIFNIGLKTNIDLEGEARTDALVYNEKTMHEAELATSSFGQGFNVTMIQMAAGYAALVNGGYYYEPHVVKQILNSSGSVVKNIEPRLIKQVISSQTSDTIVDYCNAVCEPDGTGRRARPAGYKIGGKTGTAEMNGRNETDYVISFIGHIPSENPEIICYVVIDRPNVPEQNDASYATILTRQILNEILPYLNIPMTEEMSDSEREELHNLELSIFTNREKELESEGDTSENDISGQVIGLDTDPFKDGD